MSEKALSIWHGSIDIPPQGKSSQDILKAVAWRHDMSIADMLSPSRQKRYVRARWEAMHLLRNTPKVGGTKRSLPEIGRQMGGLDHTTIIFGLRKYAETIATKSDAKREAEAA